MALDRHALMQALHRRRDGDPREQWDDQLHRQAAGEVGLIVDAVGDAGATAVMYDKPDP